MEKGNRRFGVLALDSAITRSRWALVFTTDEGVVVSDEEAGPVVVIDEDPSIVLVFDTA